MGLHQAKKLLHSKGNLQQREKQPTEWGKITVNHVHDKGLLSKICKKLIQLNSKTQIIQLKNGKKIWIDIFFLFQRRHTDGQQVHEKMLNTINCQGNENQNNGMSLYLLEWLLSKTQEITSVGKDVEKGNSCVLLVEI